MDNVMNTTTTKDKVRMSAAERKRKQRAKALTNMSEGEKQVHREKESKRRSDLRTKQMKKMSEEEKSEFRRKEVVRVSTYRKSKKEQPTTLILTPSQNPYQSRQSYGKAVKKCRIELPFSPRKKKAVVSGLAKEVGLSLQDEYDKRTFGNSSLRDELKTSIEVFYLRSDISYTMPGAKDEIVVWDKFGKKRLRKYYLTMYLREAYAVFKETIPEGEKCSYSSFCKLRPKNVLLLQDTPRDQCKCQTHENFFFKLEAMGNYYEKTLYDSILCDVSENSKCWLSECEACKDGEKFAPQKPLNILTSYKQWQTIQVPVNTKYNQDNEQDEDQQKPQKLYSKMQIVNEQVLAGEVLEEFKQSFKDVLNHVNVKRIQAHAFQEDLKEPNTRVLQIDYAMAYQCEYQNEVQSALWSRASVNLFTCAFYLNSITETLLICTDYKGKDKYATGSLLESLYANEILQDENVTKEVIWSDGPGSEFKNKFMRQLIESLSEKYNKPFVWKFSATSHGKGVVDGVGGKVKSTVRRKVMSKSKDPIVVQDCQSFVNAATSLIKSTKIIHIDKSTITDYKNSKPFDNAVEVKGISKMHVMKVWRDNTSLWKNCAYQVSSEPI